MKIKSQTIFLVLSLLLLAISGFLFTRQVLPVSSESQAVALSDWAYGSGGNLNVMVTYPKTLETGRKSLITVAYQPDKALEGVLPQGVVFDLQLDMLNTVVQPQKRMLIPVESGRKTFAWEVEPFKAGVAEATLSLTLGDNSLNGNYAITAQQQIDFSMEVIESALTQDELITWGFVCLGSAMLSLMAAWLLNKNKQPIKNQR